MRGIPSLAEAQRAYAAYQQYNELDKQYGITDKAVAGTNSRARPPTNPTRPPPPQRPRPPAPRDPPAPSGRGMSPPDYAPSLPRPHPLPLTRLPSLAPPRPQPNKPPITSSVVSPPP